MSIYHQARFNCDDQKLYFLYVEIAFVIWHQVDTDLSGMKSEKNRRDQETENRFSSLNKQILSLQSENKDLQDKLSKLRLEKTQSQKDLIPIRFTIHNSWFMKLANTCTFIYFMLLLILHVVKSHQFCLLHVQHLPCSYGDSLWLPFLSI